MRPGISPIRASIDGIVGDHCWHNCCTGKTDIRKLFTSSAIRTGSGFMTLNKGARFSNEEAFLLFLRHVGLKLCLMKLLLVARCKIMLVQFAALPLYRDGHMDLSKTPLLFPLEL